MSHMSNATGQKDFDVAIVGGGMVGASLACALGESGLRIAVLDRTAFDPDLPVRQ